ncbi:SDR family oxidoreductase [Bradyrhizobium neotropicale]|uniref:SDR family oxidoreductase n=1 Tax=Bradyrhizobium neotropicale TaxID=1497615 RepID=UPI001AD6A573|nr:SDR family oxidoreductase [Bradyrhizobium neotropicale]MBO4226820.1 SDR family NAD(P)-dependent oxidoreductase [Bradyrhizobium neotropicale]
MNVEAGESKHSRRAVVTGTGGLGFETALALSRMGWQVVIAGRDVEKGARAVRKIQDQVARATVAFEKVDLASLVSIEAFGRRMNSSYAGFDVLINNAAVMTPPRRRVTADGFELQFGVNYLGHFALTSHMLPLLRGGTEPRVVNVSSIANRGAALNFGDLQSETAYKAFEAYGQSKLAQLVFAFELQRRSLAGGWGLASIAAHPGLARTDLIPNGAGKVSVAFVLRQLMLPLFQSPAQGARHVLFAANSPSAKPGGYYGPSRLGEVRGDTAPAKVPQQALNQENATRLFDVSEQLAGLTFGTSRP